MTAKDLWAKLVTLYGWLGGHPTVAGFAVGFLTGVVVMKWA